MIFKTARRKCRKNALRKVVNPAILRLLCCLSKEFSFGKLFSDHKHLSKIERAVI